VAIIGAGYLGYALVRLAVRAGRHAAFVHAAELWRAERWLHLDVEPSLNHLASASPALAEAAGYYYGLLHFTVTPLVLGWLYLRRPPAFPRLRSALVLATSAANIVFWTWPAAPPRYSVPGMTDILVSHHVLGAADPHGPDRLVNLYAAMPSLHVAWATWCAVAVSTATRSRWRHLAWLYSSATVLVVLASANHFLLDAAGGLAVLGLGLLGTAGKQRRLRRSSGSRCPAGPGRPGRTTDEHRHHHRPPGGRRRPGGSAAHRVRVGRRRPPGHAGWDGPRPARARHHPRPAGRHLGRGPECRVPCLPPADRGHRRTLAAIWRGLRRSESSPSARAWSGSGDYAAED
jgi:PAP2 superfamily